MQRRLKDGCRNAGILASLPETTERFLERLRRRAGRKKQSRVLTLSLASGRARVSPFIRKPAPIGRRNSRNAARAHFQTIPQALPGKRLRLRGARKTGRGLGGVRPLRTYSSGYQG